MAKPPETPPHSDLTGIHRDEPKVQAAASKGHGSADLKRSAEQTIGRPDYSEEKSRDDRS